MLLMRECVDGLSARERNLAVGQYFSGLGTFPNFFSLHLEHPTGKDSPLLLLVDVVECTQEEDDEFFLVINPGDRRYRVPCALVLAYAHVERDRIRRLATNTLAVNSPALDLEDHAALRILNGDALYKLPFERVSRQRVTSGWRDGSVLD